jgi:hypothetical protein
MRTLVCVLLSEVVLAGCGWRQQAQRSPAGGGTLTLAATNSPAGNEKLIVTPETSLVGKVVRVNESARFAVLNFPVGIVPGLEQRLSVYRRGLKVAEVKVTGPRQDDNMVADILTGEVQVGDELRSN